MTHQSAPEVIATIGIDLGKNTFHLIGMDARGKIVLRRKVCPRTAAILPSERPCLSDRPGGLYRSSSRRPTACCSRP